MNYAIILAGGSGTRAGGFLPKQFYPLAGIPVVWHSVRRFKEFDPECKIIIVLNKDYFGYWEEKITPMSCQDGIEVMLVEGGRSRIASVRNGLAAVPLEKDSKIFIHDAARPFINSELISRGEKSVRPGVGAVPVMPVVDSLREIGGESTKSVDRSRFLIVQTPQVFMAADIIPAYNAVKDETGLTDDASVAEKNSLVITTYPGDDANIKITNPIDFSIAEILVGLRQKHINR